MAGAVDVAIGPEGVEGGGVQGAGEFQLRLLHRLGSLRIQAHQEGLHAPGTDVEMEFVLRGLGGADDGLVPVQLERFGNEVGKADGGILGTPTVQLIYAHDIPAAVLGLLQGA